METMALEEMGFEGGSAQSQSLQCPNSVSVKMPARLALHPRDLMVEIQWESMILQGTGYVYVDSVNTG